MGDKRRKQKKPVKIVKKKSQDKARG